ncbi:MAG: putative calcium-binding protein [Thermomicrobiales bacterium]|nr:putative calcium-binding protein [Thermomicrobiales bacterium]
MANRRGDEVMKVTRAVAVVAGAALAASLYTGTVFAQSESASAEDGKPASEAPAETATTPNAPLGANLTPSLGALPLGPGILSGSGSGNAGSSSVSMAPGTLTSGVAREGANAVRAPEAEPAPAPVAEAAPVVDAAPVETSEPVVADAAVATAEDSDADNYLDAAELEVGLDPSDPDSDDDGVADGDEVNIYLTDPFNGDSDGDGASDGEELFSTMTDPLVWDDFAAE